jgi:hypothetical protein
VNANFERMCRRAGGYSLPWLIELSNGVKTLRFINDVQSRIYGGHTYVASTFNYTPNPQENGLSGGGTLDIAAADAGDANGIITLVQNATSIILEVVGVLLEDGTVSEIKTFSHSYGTVRLNGRDASFSFERDDRLGMSFPALIFTHYNNRGVS